MMKLNYYNLEQQTPTAQNVASRNKNCGPKINCPWLMQYFQRNMCYTA